MSWSWISTLPSKYYTNQICQTRGAEMYLIEFICQHYGYSDFIANGLIMSGKVLVNDEVCIWGKYKIKEKHQIRIKNKQKKFVTRSGYKLEKAIKSFALKIAGCIALDLGTSEGGFTDCLLQYGAEKVYAVDVAYGILNYNLRIDPRVIVLERKNARYLTKQDIQETVDYIVADVSFISLRKVIPPNLKYLQYDGSAVLLFKPQFELGKDVLGKNGIPKYDEDVIDAMYLFVQDMEKEGLYINKIAISPIKGNSGNTEYLLLGGKKKSDILSLENIACCVKKRDHYHE